MGCQAEWGRADLPLPRRLLSDWHSVLRIGCTEPLHLASLDRIPQIPGGTGKVKGPSLNNPPIFRNRDRHRHPHHSLARGQIDISESTSHVLERPPVVPEVRVTVVSRQVAAHLQGSAPREVIPLAGFELLGGSHKVHHHIKLNRWMHSDLAWWDMFLESWKGVSILCPLYYLFHSTRYTRMHPVHQVVELYGIATGSSLAGPLSTQQPLTPKGARAGGHGLCHLGACLAGPGGLCPLG